MMTLASRAELVGKQGGGTRGGKVQYALKQFGSAVKAMGVETYWPSSPQNSQNRVS